MSKGKISIVEEAYEVNNIFIPWNEKVPRASPYRAHSFAVLEEYIDEGFQFEFNKTQLNSEDVVYFAKSSLTPRSRIKEYCEENNITLNKTNRVENANTFVFNFEDIKEIKNEKFKEYWVVPAKQAPFNVQTTISGDCILYVAVNPGSYSNYPPGVDLKLKQFPVVKAIELDSVKLEFTYRTFKVFLDKPNAKIVYDQTILNNINNQNIDYDMYLNLRSTLQASEEGNSTIGAGIIGNCNPEDNKIPLVLLMAENWDKIKSLKQTNFTSRALVEYYKGYSFYNGWKSVLTDLLNDLKGKDISDDHKRILELFLIEQIKKEFGERGGRDPLPLDITEIKFNLK